MIIMVKFRLFYFGYTILTWFSLAFAVPEPKPYIGQILIFEWIVWINAWIWIFLSVYAFIKAIVWFEKKRKATK